MKRPVRRVLLATLIVCVYLLWQPAPTRREFMIRAEWATSITQGTLTDSQQTDLIPIESGDGFAYVNDAGDIVYRGRVAYRVALSPLGFVNHGRVPAQLVLQSPQGSMLASLPVSGYPFFSEDRLFVVSEGGGALSEWNASGRRLWQTNLPSPITSAAASSSLFAIGLAAGGALVVDNAGKPVELQRATTDREAIVYAVDVADAPSRVAVVSGAGGVSGGAAATDAGAYPPGSVPAVVTLYDLASGTGVPIVRRSFARHADADPIVRLDPDAPVVLYSSVTSGGDRLVGIDVDNGDEYLVELSYPPRDIAFVEDPAIRAVLGVSSRPDPAHGFDRRSELALVSADGVVAARVDWAASASAVRAIGSRLVMRVDDRALAVTLEVR